MSTTCLHCGAETSNGLWLCDLSQRQAGQWLEQLPIDFRNLSRQRRPGRPNGSVGGGGNWNEGGSVSVVAVLGRAENDISTWARALQDDRGIELPEADTEVELFAALCSLLGSLLTTIGTLEWAGEFVKGVARHGQTLRAVTEESIPGWYAGSCRQSTGRDMEGNEYTCGTPTYVIPGDTWLTCKGCGTTTFARDHVDIVLDEARNWVARPKALAEAIVALVDGEHSVHQLHDRIRQWSARERITAFRKVDEDGDEVGPKRYQLGDVLDLVLSAADGSASSERIGA